MPTLKLGVLVSGSGSNLQAILDAVANGSLDAQVKLVVSNVAGARALDRAERASVPHRCIPHGDYPGREAFEAAIEAALVEAGVDWVVLAGFMRILTTGFVRRFEGRMLNIHPALLPAFPGVHAQRQALEYGAKLSGCSVHFVDEGMDTGPVIAQRAVPVLDDDDEASLSSRILEQEHQLLVEVLRWVAAGRVCIARRAEARPRVTIQPA